MNENSDTATLTKTAVMLDEDRFWAIVDRSVKNTKDQHSQENFLVQEIEKLTPAEMIGFRLRTDKLLYDTYNSDIWCAGYIMNQGCSDDGFEYFRCWIISRGKATYENAKKNPDFLVKETGSSGEFDFEGFRVVAFTAFKNKTGKGLYDYIDYDKFTTHESKYPPMKFTWKENDPESMRKVCPLLFAKFWGK